MWRELHVGDGYLDDTARKNSCTTPVCIRSATCLLGLHCSSKYSSQSLSKKGISHGGAKVAVYVLPFIVSEIGPHLSIPCKSGQSYF